MDVVSFEDWKAASTQRAWLVINMVAVVSFLCHVYSFEEGNDKRNNLSLRDYMVKFDAGGRLNLLPWRVPRRLTLVMRARAFRHASCEHLQ